MDGCFSSSSSSSGSIQMRIILIMMIKKFSSHTNTHTHIFESIFYENLEEMIKSIFCRWNLIDDEDIWDFNCLSVQLNTKSQKIRRIMECWNFSQMMNYIEIYSKALNIVCGNHETIHEENGGDEEKWETIHVHIKPISLQWKMSVFNFFRYPRCSKNRRKAKVQSKPRAMKSNIEKNETWEYNKIATYH